jgi:heptosyltransferase-2
LDELLKFDPALDRVLLWEKTSAGFLRQEAFDLGILTTGSFSSARQFFFGKVKIRLGYPGDGRFFFLNLRPAPPPSQAHQLVFYRKLLQPLKADLAFQLPRLYVQKTEIAAAGKSLAALGWKPAQKIIALAPFAAFGPAKRWPLPNFLALALKLREKTGALILVLGDRRFQEEARGVTLKDPGCINLTGKTTLRELLAYLSLADLVVANDSGPMHLAAALKRPLIALFGSSDPKRTFPFYAEGAKLLQAKFPCSPCFLKQCPKKLFCLEALSVEKVLETVLESKPFFQEAHV